MLKFDIMEISFRAISISHKTAPIGERELLALNHTQIENLLSYLKEYADLSDVLVLSTCNRTEIYYQSAENKIDDLLKLIALQNSLSDVARYKKYFVDLEGKAAIAHLFNVAMGLEAQVVGDFQISNQVKRAYQASADAGLAGPFLHRLMHTIFFTNKRVIQETAFRDGAASVSYATTEMVKEIAMSIADPTILVLGIGEIGADVCRNLIDSKIQNIFISNRTPSVAVALAEECGFNTLPFNDAVNHISKADIIISCISKDEPFITTNTISKMQLLSHKFFFDLSVPRSIEVEIEAIDGALLYNIDDIQSKANAVLQKRINAIPDVQAIISSSLEEFSDWSKEMIVSPTINKLKDALESIRQAEIARYLKGTDLDQNAIVDKITKSMMQKIIKLPVLQLKAACKRGEAETLIDVLNDLFDLEKSQDNQK